MKKKKLVLVSACTLLIGLLVVAFVFRDSLFSGRKDSTVIRPQDDLYAAVNEDWLASTEIPADRISVGGLEDVASDVEVRLMEDFDQMLSENEDHGSLSEFLKLYAMASDYDKRNAEGAAPLRPYLEVIGGMRNLSDFNAALPEIILNGMSLPQTASPLVVYVQPDMMNARQNAFYMDMPPLILPDASFYEMPEGIALLAHYQETLQKLLEMSGRTPEEAVTIAEQTLAFDSLLKPYFKSALEKSDLSAVYNPISPDDLAASSGSIDWTALLSALLPESPGNVIISNPDFYQALDEVINEANFPLLKGWLYGQTVFNASPALSEEMMAAADSFNRLLTGKAGMENPQKLAYRLAAVPYDQLIGEYYGRTTFGDEAKEDVTRMADHIRSVYARRLEENDWLSKETIKAALTKLEAMTIHIGYPNKLGPVYGQMQVKDGTLLDNYVTLMRVLTEENWGRSGQNVDPDEWILPAHSANAAYHMQSNSINFPAAILQEPFYSKEYTASQNYGGIGAIIAHEITHAFDSNGAKFDQYGSMNDWWTEADYKAFQERTDAMAEMFDGMPYAGGQVNGELTVTENVSDAGGLSSALEVVQSLPDGDVKAFFESWATIWRLKVTPEFEQLLLARDTHAPYKLRANVQAQNLDAFHEAFGVKEGDGMYLAPEKRVKVW